VVCCSVLKFDDDDDCCFYCNCCFSGGFLVLLVLNLQPNQKKTPLGGCDLLIKLWAGLNANNLLGLCNYTVT